MKNAAHSILDQDWIDYMDNTLNEAERDRIEAHLMSCMTCWRFYQSMSDASATLREISEEFKRNFAPTEEEVSGGLNRLMNIISAKPEPDRGPASSSAARNVKVEIIERALREDQHESQIIRERLRFLQSVISPMCGSKVAIQALNAAAKSSSVRTLDHVTADNWTSFLLNLVPIMKVMSGETGARLVWESGQLYAEELAR